MASNAQLERMSQIVRSRAIRYRKLLWQLTHAMPAVPKRAVFVVGCHRSGTSIMMQTIEKSPYTWVYHETHRSFAFHAFRLRSDATIARLVRWSRAPWVVFKPICDAHWTDRMLDRHPGSVAVWPYRRYQDVVNSSVRKWGEHHKDITRSIARGEFEALGWRGERLPPDVVDTIRRLFREDMSHEEGSCLVWWMRNRFYFELGLDRDPRVLIQRYEDLVTRPRDTLERLFAFMGKCPLDDTDLSDINPRSLSKHPFPSVAPEIAELCEAMMQRLDAACASNASRP